MNDMKYNGFYFWMFKSSMKKVLIEKYGKAYASEIMKKSKKVYRELEHVHTKESKIIANRINPAKTISSLS